MVDDAEYPEGQAPDPAISHLFCKYGIEKPKRIRFAARIRRVDQVASLGESQTAFEEKLPLILGDLWPAGDANRVFETMNWVCIWQGCVDRASETRDQEKQARKDPLGKVAELTDGDRGRMWNRFNEDHPDVLLIASTTPHKVAIEQFRNDWAKHHIVQAYVLGRIYLESDPVQAAPSWTKNIDDLCTITSHYQPMTISKLESVDARIQALFIILDILGICPMNFESGPVKYIHKIQDRRTEAEDPFVFTIYVDALMRKEIHRLNCYQSKKYKSFSEALLEVVDNQGDRLVERALHRCMRQQARDMLQILTQDLAHALEPASAKPPGERRSPPGEDDRPTPTKGKRAEKKKRQAENKKRKFEELVKENKSLKAPKDDDRSKPIPPWSGKKKGDPTPRDRVPKAEWQKLAELNYSLPGGRTACKFYHSSKGCKWGTSCRDDHSVCPQCHKKHRWSDHHL